MRLPLVRRIAAMALLLAWSTALVREAASSEAPSAKKPGQTAKVLVARKTALPGIGTALRREPGPADAAAEPVSAPASGGRDDLTQPSYLRIFFAGMPHGHRDPPA